MNPTIPQPPKNIIYTALFVDNPAELAKMFPPKHSKVFAHHSTNKFRPEDAADLEVGRKVRIKILARVSDDKGDVLLVENPKSENTQPHITLSCADGVAPKYSQELLATAAKNGSLVFFDEPFFIDDTEGYFDGTKDVTST